MKATLIRNLQLVGVSVEGARTYKELLRRANVAIHELMDSMTPKLIALKEARIALTKLRSLSMADALSKEQLGNLLRASGYPTVIQGIPQLSSLLFSQMQFAYEV